MLLSYRSLWSRFCKLFNTKHAELAEKKGDIEKEMNLPFKTSLDAKVGDWVTHYIDGTPMPSPMIVTYDSGIL